MDETKVEVNEKKTATSKCCPCGTGTCITLTVCGLALCVYIIWTTTTVLELRELTKTNEQLIKQLEKRLAQLNPQDEDNIIPWEQQSTLKSKLTFPGKQPSIQYREKRSGKNNKKRRGHKCRCKCKGKCRGKRGPRGQTGLTGPPGPTGPQGIQGVNGLRGPKGSVENVQGQVRSSSERIQQSTTKIIAAQFFKPQYQMGGKTPSSESLRCRNNWNGGTYCPNNDTYISKGSLQIVSFLDTNSLSEIDHITSPLQHMKDGNYRVSHTGLYLLYMNVQMAVYDVHHDMQLMVDNKPALYCRESIDYKIPFGDGSNGTFSTGQKLINARVKTCSSMAVMYITKKKDIALYLVEADRAIELGPGTYFGAVLLSPTT